MEVLVVLLVLFLLIVYSAEEIAAILFGFSSVGLLLLAALVIYFLPSSSIGWYMAGIGLVGAFISSWCNSKAPKRRFDYSDED